MKDIRVDSEGEFRCWNCGNKGLLAKRTFRSKMFVGVGALLTKKKLKCQTCGEYNDTGNAQPFTGPESRKWRKAYEKEQAAKSAAVLAAEQRSAELAAKAVVAELAEAERQASSAGSAEAPPPPPPMMAPAAPAAPASWLPDPVARHQLRYWDGHEWTAHVSDEGAMGSDPLP